MCNVSDEFEMTDKTPNFQRIYNWALPPLSFVSVSTGAVKKNEPNYALFKAEFGSCKITLK